MNRPLFLAQAWERGRFMVPVHGIKVVRVFHEPRLVWSSAFRRLERLGPAEAGTPNCQRLHGPNAWRRRTAALQDAGALATVARTAARFWSAPALRPCGAFPMDARQSKAPEHWRSPRRYRAVRSSWS